MNQYFYLSMPPMSIHGKNDDLIKNINKKMEEKRISYVC